MTTTLPDYWTHVAAVIDNPLPFLVPVPREVAFGVLKQVIENYSLEKTEWSLAGRPDLNTFTLKHKIEFDSEIGRLREQVELTTRVSVVYGYTRVQMNFHVSTPTYRQTYAPKRLIMPDLTPPRVDTNLSQFYLLVRNELSGESLEHLLSQHSANPAFNTLHDLTLSALIQYDQPLPVAALVAHLSISPDLVDVARKYFACSPAYEFLVGKLSCVPGLDPNSRPVAGTTPSVPEPLTPAPTESLVPLPLSISELEPFRAQILEAAFKHGITNIRLFGKHLTGPAPSDKPTLDLLVSLKDPQPTSFATIEVIEALQKDLSSLLNAEVTIVNENDLHPATRDQILSAAIPL